MRDELQTERTTSPALEAPTVDDRLIWETWTSMYHLPTVVVAARLACFLFLLKPQLPLRTWLPAFRWGPVGRKSCWVC
jgi:hypothetical protein